MVYTQDEVQTIKNNLAKIELYVNERYVPRLRKYDKLSVEFGDIRRYHGFRVPEYEHSFGFDWSGEVWFRTGGLYLNFDTDNEHCIYRSVTYAEDLLLCWQQVKSLIEAEFDRRAKRMAALNDFEV